MRLCCFADPISIHTRRVVAALAKRGVAVHVVYHGPGEVPGATYESFAVPPIENDGRPWQVRHDEYLRRFFESYDMVALFFLHDWGLSEQVVRAGKLAVWAWGSDVCPPPGSAQPTKRQKLARQQLVQMADTVIACSSTFADDVARFGRIPRKRVRVVPLGVDTQQFADRADEPFAPVVGCFKGFGHAYGIEHFVRSMPVIAAAIPDVRFELVGDGSTRNDCADLAARLGVDDRISWTGRVNHEDIPPILSGWQVSVIPSVREAFGVAALESQAMGVPVVASRVGGLRKTVIHGQTGWLVTPGREEELAAAVIGLLKDRDRRRELGAAGRERVKRLFEWNNVADAWLDALSCHGKHVVTCGSLEPVESRSDNKCN